MNHRADQRRSGETSLERKCRLMFGCCLLALIGAAFYWVDSIAENLVLETTRRQAGDLVDLTLLRAHFEVWETNPQPSAREFVRQLSGDLVYNAPHPHEILAWEPLSNIKRVKAPQDGAERDILGKLAAQLADQAARKKDSAAEQAAHALETGFLAEPDAERVFHDMRVRARDNENYVYYTPVRWKQSCKTCHVNTVEAGAVSPAEAVAAEPSTPLHVVKISVPFKETQDAITNARTVLFAVAIGTVCAALLALYVLVRYFIVRPLQHLREVSDAISRGDTQRRAEIHTNDEFEELGGSFNRMLHRLIDAQAALQALNDSLNRKNDEQAELNMRLHEMNQMKSEFLANMSHELRTPLNSIIGFSEVLGGIDSLTEKQRRYAHNIQKSGRVLLEMINDILDLAKMEAGRMTVSPTEFDVGFITHAHCELARSLAEEKNIELTARVQPDLPPLRQDQTKLQQVLTNLLSNAIKFTPEGGRIQVTVTRVEPGDLLLAVADTGVGIAREDREVIFEKFRQGTVARRGDNLTREFSGTGLGLSIVKELCRLMQGDVSFESELGKGSTFYVRLPWEIHEHGPREAPLETKLRELQQTRRLDGARGRAVDSEPAAAREGAI